ncbi:methyltransferase domain-containing protein [Polynucleobacter sp. es-GGE-1]|uniref:class I SAM-dependent methyltransferase n=1 Tax=Polynucleobacter sp. es-GGE-1 TaxID=1819724 RepID=UPI001C0AE26B|nr:class I SAM-dependent methyltransferase [Polynucleobacter sp. es-GGE-1]MBU3635535.1 methyltransferase domain-containing protein [Polynucleobacter sp. es-GGE-1]
MDNKSVAQHYDAGANNYHKQYDPENLLDITKKYPANYFRLQLLINSFLNKGVKSVIEVGVGEGTPLVNLSKLGIKVAGFDISSEMIKKAKLNFTANSLDENSLILADIQDSMSYTHLMRGGQYDALVAMGVMPHVRNDELCLKNMASMVKPGGSVFIEFRNKIFSLFTFNRYTYEFIMDDLLLGVSGELKNKISNNIIPRLSMDLPSPRTQHDDDSHSPGYDSILSKFHNPLTMNELFERCGFSEVNLLWYHYHPAPPSLANDDASLFRHEALKLEHDALGWRGMFLCSAFVVEAIKK